MLKTLTVITFIAVAIAPTVQAIPLAQEFEEITTHGAGSVNVAENSFSKASRYDTAPHLLAQSLQGLTMSQREEIQPVPEPSTLFLVGLGLISLSAFGRKFKK
jgi:hypothetical protein